MLLREGRPKLVLRSENFLTVGYCPDICDRLTERGLISWKAKCGLALANIMDMIL